MGYRFIGDIAGGGFGQDVSLIADLDGDGEAEVFIGSLRGLSPEPVGYLIASSDLGTLDAADGVVDGEIDLAHVGSGAGGLEILGASYARDSSDGLLLSAAEVGAGTVYSVSGADIAALDAADGATDGTLDLAALTGPEAYVFEGVDTGDHTGRILAGLDDIDGDGASEVLISAALSDAGGTESGAVWLLNSDDFDTLDAGSSGGADGTIGLADIGDELAAGAGYLFVGGAAGDRLTARETGLLEDIDGDGARDLLLTSYWADPNGSNAGAVYLVSLDDLADLDARDGTDGRIDMGEVGAAQAGGGRLGYVFEGASAGDKAGVAVTTVSDIDGDGRDEIAISAPFADRDGTLPVETAGNGIVYLVNSSSLDALDAMDGADGRIDLGNVTATDGDGQPFGYRLVGPDENPEIEMAGVTLAAAGDIDGDGAEDLVIGALRGGTDAQGKTYIVSMADLAELDGFGGAAQDGTIDLEDIGATGGDGAPLGYSVLGASPGDFASGSLSVIPGHDGSGQSDLLIGARLADDGGADAGEAYLLRGEQLDAMDAADGSLDGQISLANAPVCFVRGTLILTDRGEVAVQDIRPGDRVITLDAGPQPVVWTGMTRRRAAGSVAPVRIAAGALGNARDLWVSPQHRMLVRGPDGAEGFRPAIHLVDGRTIRQVAGGTVTYFHLMCARHQVILAEGTPAESFFPGPEAWKSLPPAARAELLGLFPGLAPAAATRPSGRPGPPPVPGFGPLARPVLPRPASARPMARAVSTVPA